MSIRQRALIGGAASVGVVGTSVWLFLGAAPGQVATELQIEDTAEILYAPDLEAAVEDLRFHEPTTVAVFTHRGGSEALTDDYALNDATLAFARETRTDWLSDDEQHWADDLFILGVDPEGRLVGTYFGENRAVPQSAQDDIQEATKDDFRNGRWTDGSIAGIRAAADEMNQPVIRSTAGTVAAAGLSLATVAGSGAYLLVGTRRAGRSRTARAAGDRAMANVVRDYDETQVHANLIPEESRYGGAMLRRYEDYTASFRELTELGNRAKGIPESSFDSKASLSTLTEYQEAGEALDTLDDVIADTAALLNLDHTWPKSWERQVAPLREDLDGVEELLTSTLDEEVRGLDEAQPLREFASQALVDLDQLYGGLEDRTVTPDDALDRLRTTRDELSGHLDTLAGAVARAYSEDESEQETLKDALGDERAGHEPTILSTANPTWTWISINSFTSGYSTGTQAVQASRSTSSGSTSGYSSGGSFSGAGSSSRF
ncbi:DUF5129 domain-containing protein [Ornithinimicrobium sp. F0845]|uniref:DUF5129 domain-containing protein n=1 Tax=Ornithinimicrobium sp. F0845 TaxID=2926412 RepID=UPI001FF4DCBE|nr:DUF5129 domain-containing protein [Ornithinimicrobium sp. F0845]MCK0110862.1 DUF5129 domain-containing protein [Ornithinimicrobium sp. F0845]